MRFLTFIINFLEVKWSSWFFCSMKEQQAIWENSDLALLSLIFNTSINCNHECSWLSVLRGWTSPYAKVSLNISVLRTLIGQFLCFQNFIINFCSLFYPSYPSIKLCQPLLCFNLLESSLALLSEKFKLNKL